MNKRLTYILLPLLLVGIIVSFSLAEESAMDLETLIGLAQLNDVDLAIAELDIEIAELDYEEALKQAKLNDYEGGVRTDRVKRFSIVNIDPENAKTDLMMAKYDKDYRMDQIADDVEMAHEAIVLKNEEIAVEEKRLEHLALVAENGEKQYELGMISYLDYDQLLDDHQAQIYTVEELKLDQLNDILDFEFLIGEKLPEGYEFGASVSLDFSVFNLDTLEYQHAKDNDWDYYLAAQDVDQKQALFDTIALYYDEDDKEHKEAALNLRSATYSFKDAQGTFELEYAQLVNNIEVLIKKLQLYQGYRDIAMDELEIAEVKYDLGLISYEDIVEKELGVVEAKYDLSEIVHEYNLTINETNAYINFDIVDYE